MCGPLCSCDNEKTPKEVPICKDQCSETFGDKLPYVSCTFLIELTGSTLDCPYYPDRMDQCAIRKLKKSEEDYISLKKVHNSLIEFTQEKIDEVKNLKEGEKVSELAYNSLVDAGLQYTTLIEKENEQKDRRIEELEYVSDTLEAEIKRLNKQFGERQDSNNKQIAELQAKLGDIHRALRNFPVNANKTAVLVDIANYNLTLEQTEEFDKEDEN